MSYVGNSPAEIYSSVQKQDLTGGSGTGFTLSYPASTNEFLFLLTMFGKSLLKHILFLALL